MRYTYAAAANATTNGIALGTAGQDVYVHGLIIGLPVASGNIILYNKAVAFSGDTNNIAMKITLPSTLTENAGTYHYQAQYNFAEPLQLDGGNLMVDQAMQVTVIWEPVDEASAQN